MGLKKLLSESTYMLIFLVKRGCFTVQHPQLFMKINLHDSDRKDEVMFEVVFTLCLVLFVNFEH